MDYARRPVTHVQTCASYSHRSV